MVKSPGGLSVEITNVANQQKKKIVIYDSCKRMTQAGFEPPLADDTSNEADALPTKPPWQWHYLSLLISHKFT